MTDLDQTKLKNRLKRANGQLQGILKMIDDDRDCQEVLAQLAAVRSSVNRAMGIVVANNVVNSLCDQPIDEKQSADLQAALDLIVTSR